MAGEGATKVGFGFSKRAPERRGNLAVQQREEVPADAVKDYLTSVDGGQLESLQKAAPSQPKIIPVQQNRWNLGQQIAASKGINATLEAVLREGTMQDLKTGEDKFEMAQENEVAQAADVTYGLNKRKRQEALQLPQQHNDGGDDNNGAPIMGRGKRGVDRREDEERRFKEEMRDLPEVADSAAYEQMPIESFGEAMLRGMGWREGLNVGRAHSSKEAAQVHAIEYVPRPALLGLGADAEKALELKNKKKGGKDDATRILKPGESREAAVQMVAAPGEDGKVRHTRNVGEDLVPKTARGPRRDKRMYLGGGSHAGLACKVLEDPAPSATKVRVALLPSDEAVRVKIKYLAESKVEAEAMQREGRAKDKDDSREGEGTRQRPWLAPNIRVRVVDKKLCKGAVYLKKAEVVDVLAPDVCALKFDDDRIVQDVPQRALETALPKKGGRAVVVQGKHRGQRGMLLERNAAREEVVLRFSSDFAFHTLRMDDVAEYTGPLDEEE